MKHYIVKGNLFAVALMALLLALSVPATSLAQNEHRRGRDRDNSDWSRRNRKCAKFVNCHDASEGRWDRRGARGDRVGNIFLRNRIRNRNPRVFDNDLALRDLRRQRARDFDNRRFRSRNRDFENDRNLSRNGRGRHRGHE